MVSLDGGQSQAIIPFDTRCANLRVQMAFHRRRNNHSPNRFSVSLPQPQALHRIDHPSGFFVFPDVPSRKKPRFLQASEHALARQRLDGITAPPQAKLSHSIFKRVFSRWHWYLFVLQWTLMDQNFAPYSTPFSLYLKANSDIYSVVRINTLPTVATAISIVSAVLSGLFADKTGRFWIPVVAVTLPVLIGISMLVAWDVGENGRLAAFMLTGFEGGLSRYLTFYPNLTTNQMFSCLSNDHELGIRRHGERCRRACSGDGQYERHRPSHRRRHTSGPVAGDQCPQLSGWLPKCSWYDCSTALHGRCHIILQLEGVQEEDKVSESQRSISSKPSISADNRVFFLEHQWCSPC